MRNLNDNRLCKYQGQDVIKDFEPCVDKIGFTGHDLYHKKWGEALINGLSKEEFFEQFRASHIYKQGTSAVISVNGQSNGNNMITLENVDSSSLSFDCFIF